MLFVGTSIIHPSTEGVFLLCNILDLLIYSINKFNNEHEVKKSERGKRGYRKRIMNKQEINESIEKMKEVGDVWTEEQVNNNKRKN